MIAHTPRIVAVTTGGYLGYETTAHGPGWSVSYRVVTLQADGEQPAIAMSERLRDCHNACAGIDDPGAALAEVREILTALLPKVEDDASRPGDRWAPLSVRRALALLGAK